MRTQFCKLYFFQGLSELICCDKVMTKNLNYCRNISHLQGKGETIPVLELHLHRGPGRCTSPVHAAAKTCGFTGHAGAQGASGNA